MFGKFYIEKFSFIICSLFVCFESESRVIQESDKFNDMKRIIDFKAEDPPYKNQLNGNYSSTKMGLSALDGHKSKRDLGRPVAEKLRKTCTGSNLQISSTFISRLMKICIIGICFIIGVIIGCLRFFNVSDKLNCLKCDNLCTKKRNNTIQTTDIGHGNLIILTKTDSDTNEYLAEIFYPTEIFYPQEPSRDNPCLHNSLEKNSNPQEASENNSRKEESSKNNSLCP